MNGAGVYNRREPEKSTLYKIVLHYYEAYEEVYTDRYEKEYGYFRAEVKESIQKYLDRDEWALFHQISMFLRNFLSIFKHFMSGFTIFNKDCDYHQFNKFFIHKIWVKISINRGKIRMF